MGQHRKKTSILVKISALGKRRRDLARKVRAAREVNDTLKDRLRRK